MPGKSHGQRSLADYSVWGHKRARHDLSTKQQFNDEVGNVDFRLDFGGFETLLEVSVFIKNFRVDIISSKIGKIIPGMRHIMVRVIKADVQGSVEAVKQSLLKLSNEEVVVKVIHGGVGAITESDIALASASNAIVIGFNVRPDATAKAMAETQKVDVHLYNVIYEAIEDVTRALNGMRAAVYEEKILGHAEIRQVFKASGIGNIAGAYVRDGIFQRNCQIRVFRKDEKLYEGSLASLKRFKDDVKEVRDGSPDDPL